MLRGASTDVKWSVGAYRKLPQVHFFSEPGWGIPLAYRQQPAVVLPWGWASIWEGAGRRIRRRWWLDLNIYSIGFSDCRTQSDPKGECRKWEEKVRGTSPRRLRGLTVMGCRHIHYPTILRGWGRFPVRLFSGAIALLGREAALLFNSIIFWSTMRSHRPILPEGGWRVIFLHDILITNESASQKLCCILLKLGSSQWISEL